MVSIFTDFPESGNLSGMTRRENLLRTVRRQNPAWVLYRYDDSLSLLHPRVSVRPPEGGADDWGVRWIPTTSTEGTPRLD
jgi:hypothetical protein